MEKNLRGYERDLDAFKELLGDVDQTAVPNCAICGVTDRPMTKNLIAVSERVIAQGTPGGVEGDFYSLCHECAPLCRKCGLPRVTRTVRDFAHTVDGRIVASAACQHFHLSRFWSK